MRRRGGVQQRPRDWSKRRYRNEEHATGVGEDIGGSHRKR